MADQIRDVLDAHVFDFQVEPIMVLNPTPPCVDVYLADPGRELTETSSFAGDDADATGGEWVNVRVRVSPNDFDSSQEILFELADPESEFSVVQALYDDPTLGGLAADLNLEDRSGFRPFPTLDGGSQHMGILFRFLVIPARS